ncbi:chymotrypsin-2-like [Drosophila subobscura]|uniref:chymotrypsin-2-like n=1 Tax=Drosophila subobscura TaxID=7241 RepID=UPI00155A8B87|nr:chymotrypsin-2-like [Drosophila subobscura]
MFGATKTSCSLWLLLICLTAQPTLSRHRRKLHLRAEPDSSIGDVVAPRNLSPFQVSIQNVHQKHKCSGAILSKDWIVTTAHCMKRANVSTYRIVTGTQTLGATDARIGVYKIEYVIPHPHFDKPKKSNDIALIRTHRSIEFNSLVKEIKCLGSPLPRDSLVMHTGWSWRKGVAEKEMRGVYHRVIPYALCLSYFESRVRNPIGPGHMCLNLPRDKDYCLRETGGLLVHKTKLAGLSSFGAPCASGEPFIATRISFYYDFIRTIMRGCVRCTQEFGFQARFFDL